MFSVRVMEHDASGLNRTRRGWYCARDELAETVCHALTGLPLDGSRCHMWVEVESVD